MDTHRRTAAILLIACLPGSAWAEPSSLDLTWGAPGAGPGELDTPVGIAAAADRIYVADFHNHRIQVFGSDGTHLASWDGGPAALGAPAGVAADGHGSVYVADHYLHRIVKLGPDGARAGDWDAGSAPGAVSAPFGVALDTDGDLYVTDLEQHRVHAFSSDGVTLRSVGGSGSGPGRLYDPWGIAVDRDGRVYVADHGNDRIQVFSRAGEFLETWGADGANRLQGPMGVALGTDGSVFVTDRDASRVRRFSAHGDLLGEWKTDAPSSALGTRMGLATDGANLFATDAALHRVTRIPIAEVKAVPRVPAALSLARAWPNPSRGPVDLHFAIPVAGRLSVDIFDMNGRRIRRLPESATEPGERLLTWDGFTENGRAAPPGVYLLHARFDAGGQRRTVEGRVVLLR